DRRWILPRRWFRRQAAQKAAARQDQPCAHALDLASLLRADASPRGLRDTGVLGHGPLHGQRTSILRMCPADVSWRLTEGRERARPLDFHIDAQSCAF